MVARGMPPPVSSSISGMPVGSVPCKGQAQKRGGYWEKRKVKGAALRFAFCSPRSLYRIPAHSSARASLKSVRSLFDDPARFDRDRLAARLSALAKRQIFLGTSSWKYTGWLEQIYSPERYRSRGRMD